jgi:hypothetical protein
VLQGSGLVACSGPGGSLAGAITPVVAARAMAVLPGTRQLAVLGPGRLDVYALDDGRALRHLRVAPGAQPVVDAASGVAVYATYRQVHALDLATGRDVVLASLRRAVRALAIEPAGVAFAWNAVRGRPPVATGHVRFVPLAAVRRGNRRSWLKLAELWAATLVLNVAAGALLAIILTSHGVLRGGTDRPLVRLGERLVDSGSATLFLSAVVAGALMTLMTWFVEGAAESTGVRLVMAWLVGAVIALGAFNHAIVSTIEIVFGMRYGLDAAYADRFRNLGLAVAGNLAGGLSLVTFARFAQALGSGSSDR